MKFIVDRKTWFRGKGSNESRLLREDGTRCCIGFVGKQCGITDDLLLTHAAAHQVNSTYHMWPMWFKLGISSYPTDLAYQINDDMAITDAVREEKLTQLFVEHGDEIVFVD